MVFRTFLPFLYFALDFSSWFPTHLAFFFIGRYCLNFLFPTHLAFFSSGRYCLNSLFPTHLAFFSIGRYCLNFLSPTYLTFFSIGRYCLNFLSPTHLAFFPSGRKTLNLSQSSTLPKAYQFNKTSLFYHHPPNSYPIPIFIHLYLSTFICTPYTTSYFIQSF